MVGTEILKANAVGSPLRAGCKSPAQFLIGGYNHVQNKKEKEQHGQRVNGNTCQFKRQDKTLLRL
jgi:hypothetical protein